MYTFVNLLFILTLLLYGRGQGLQCPSSFTLSSTTGYCYGLTSGTATRDNLVCPAGHLASFASSTEATVVITNKCFGLATAEFWTGLDMPIDSTANPPLLFSWYPASITTSTTFVQSSDLNSFRGNNCDNEWKNNRGGYVTAGKLCAGVTNGAGPAYVGCCQATVIPTPSVTASQTSSPSITASNTRTSSETASVTRTSTGTASQTASQSSTSTQTRTPTQTSSNTRTGTVTPSTTRSLSSTSSNTRSSTVTPSTTKSFSSTSSNSATQTATKTQTPSRSPTASNTRTETSTVTPSKSASITASTTRSFSSTASNTITPSVTPSETKTPSRTPPVTQSPSMTPSMTRTPSVTAPNTKSETVTPSVTRTPASTGTSSRSISLSSTASRTNSPTASGSASLSGTGTGTRTPSASITQSKTPSWTATTTRTASHSLTPSRTPTGEPTRQAWSPSPTVTPSGTPSVTPSDTNTASFTRTGTSSASFTGTVTSSASFTSTATSSNSASVSSTSSQSASMTPSRSQSASATPSRSQSPSTTPAPFQIVGTFASNFTQDFFHLNIQISSSLYFTANGTVRVALNSTICSGAAFSASTTVTATCPIAFAYWVEALLTLTVAKVQGVLSASWYKFGYPLPPAVVSVSPPTPSFGQVISISAPNIGDLSLDEYTINFASVGAELVGECSDITVVDRNRVNCLILRVKERAFLSGILAVVRLKNNNKPVELPVPVQIAKPSVSLSPVGLLTKLESGRRFHAMISGMESAPRAQRDFDYTRAWIGGYSNQSLDATGYRPMVHSVSGQWAVLDEANALATVRMGTVSQGSLSVKTNDEVLHLLKPTVHNVQPPVIQWGARLENETYSFRISGQHFGASTSNSIQQLAFGDIPCGSHVYMSDRTLVCQGWQLKGTDLSALDTSFPLSITWHGMIVPLNTSLQVRTHLSVYGVIPSIIQPGAKVTIFGSGFSSVYAANSVVYFGDGECTNLQLYGDGVATCFAPAPDPALPGFPAAPVLFTNGAGVYNVEAVSVYYQVSLDVGWLTASPLGLQLPSGAAAALVGANPRVAVRITGYGRATCVMQVQQLGSVQGRRATIVSGAAVTTDVRGAAQVDFPNLGIHIMSNASAELHVACRDGDGGGFSTNSTLPFATFAWSLSWDAASEEILSGIKGFETVPTVQAHISVDGAIDSPVDVSDLFDCSIVFLAVGRTAAKQASLEVRASAVDVCGPSDDATTFCVHYTGFSVSSLLLNTTYEVIASCTWSPTMEQLQSSAIRLTTLDASATWHINGSTPNAVGSFNLLQKREYVSVVQLVYDMRTTDIAGVTIPCVLHILDRFAMGVTSTVATLSARASISALMLSVDGPPSSFATCALKCKFMEQTIWSNTLTLLPATLTIVNTTLLPTWAMISTVDNLFPLPRFGLSLSTDAIAQREANVVCGISAQFSDLQVTFGQGHNDQEFRMGLTPVTISDAILSTTGDASQHFGSLLELSIKCKGDDGESLPSITFTVAIPAARLEALTVFPKEAGPQGQLLPWRAIFKADFPSKQQLYGDERLRFELQLFSAMQCDAYVAVDDDAGASAYLRGGEAWVENYEVSFGGYIITGHRGKAYSIVSYCSVGKLYAHISQSIRTADCGVGTIPAEINCEYCPEGSYSLGAGQEHCIPCPSSGSKCRGGTIQLLPNFYRPPSQNGLLLFPDSELHVCYNIDACTLNETSMTYGCSTGYKGALCGVCDADSDYVAFRKVCTKCWAKELNEFILALIVAACIAGTAYLGLRKTTGGRSDLQVVVRITLAYIQALTSLQLMRAGSTAVFRSVMGWTEAIGTSVVSIGPVQCITRMSLLGRYTGTILMPVVLASLVIASVSLVHACKACKGLRWKRSSCANSMRAWFQQGRHVSTATLLASLSYMPVVTASLQVLDCMKTPIDGTYYVAADLSLACDSSTYVLIKVIASVVLIAFGLGFPGGIFWKLYRTPDAMLANEQFRNSFSFLYDGYSTGQKDTRGGTRSRWAPRLVWWETVVLLRKGSIVCLSVIVTNPYYQVVGAILVFAAFMFIQQAFSPYTNPLFNRLETMALATLFLTSSGSGLLLKWLDKQSPTNNITTLDGTIISGILILMNILTVFVLVGVIVKFLLQRRRSLPLFTKVMSARNLLHQTAADDQVSKPVVWHRRHSALMDTFTTISPLYVAEEHKLAARPHRVSKLSVVYQPVQTHQKPVVNR